jgi:hypothetical protein
LTRWGRKPLYQWASSLAWANTRLKGQKVDASSPPAHEDPSDQRVSYAEPASAA